MRKIADINPTQVRIIGSLLEKEQATPEYYPMTTNALLAACNQKTNRDPVMRLSEDELSRELETLRNEVLVWRNDSGRVPHWSQSISRRLSLTPEERALLTVLMLRGPQTAGELRGRTQRLHAFSDLEEIEATLQGMSGEERDLVVELSRQPGQKENRWAQRLGGEEWPDGSTATAPPSVPARVQTQSASGEVADLSERLSRLEAMVESLSQALQRLRDDLGA